MELKLEESHKHKSDELKIPNQKQYPIGFQPSKMMLEEM
jgi:hypothetical protein